MKTIITSSGPDLKASMDPRFGRCEFFCILDEETGKTEFLENKAKFQSSAAGTAAAEKVVELSVKKVISGDFGPKAKSMLDRFGIHMVIMKNEGQPIADIIGKVTG